MAICAKGVYQTNGQWYLAIDFYNTNVTTCAYVIETPGSSLTAWQELGNLSIANAAVISVYVGVVWAVAWGARAIGKMLLTSSESES